MAHFYGPLCMFHISRINQEYFMLLWAGCGLNFHKRCAYNVPDNCTNQKERRKSSLTSDDANAQVSTLYSLDTKSAQEEIKLEAVKDCKPPQRQLILQNSYNCFCSAVVKIPLRNSWIQIVTRSAPKSYGLLRMRHPIRRPLVELSLSKIHTIASILQWQKFLQNVLVSTSRSGLPPKSIFVASHTSHPSKKFRSNSSASFCFILLTDKPTKVKTQPPWRKKRQKNKLL